MSKPDSMVDFVGALGGAIADCEEDTVRAMLAQSPELVNGYDWDGRTPLIVALDLGYENMVELLLERGANPDLPDREGRLPLIAALDFNCASLLEPLLRYGANVHRRDPKTDESYLDIAYRKKAFAGAVLLIQYGVKPEQALFATNKEFQEWVQWEAMALYAADCGNWEALKTALDHGVDPNTESQESLQANRSLLMLAIRNGNESVTRLLVSRGADLQKRNWIGETPLHLATAEADESIVALLLEQGAEVDATDHWGHTPLMIVAMMGATKVARLLRKAGASAILRDNVGKTAADYAAEREEDNQINETHEKRTVLIVGGMENREHMDRVAEWISADDFVAVSTDDIANATNLVAKIKPVVVVVIGIVEWDGKGDYLVKRVNALIPQPATIYVSLNGNVHSNMRSASGEERYKLAEEGYICDAAITIESGRGVFLDLSQRIASRYSHT